MKKNKEPKEVKNKKRILSKEELKEISKLMKMNLRCDIK